jgi:hypothetical protein
MRAGLSLGRSPTHVRSTPDSGRKFKTRHNRPRYRTAERRDELASLQLVKLHSRPADCHSRGRIVAHRAAPRSLPTVRLPSETPRQRGPHRTAASAITGPQ